MLNILASLYSHGASLCHGYQNPQVLKSLTQHVPLCILEVISGDDVQCFVRKGAVLDFEIGKPAYSIKHFFIFLHIFSPRLIESQGCGIHKYAGLTVLSCERIDI